jgi:histone H3/H4
MADVIKKAGVRENAEGLNVGSGFYEALDEKVKELIDDASRRAEGNGRRTVKARDA